MKYRSIKTPPATGNISVADAVRAARTVALSAVNGRFVKGKGSTPRTTIKYNAVTTSPPTKIKKTASKSRAGASLSKTRVKAARKK